MGGASSLLFCTFKHKIIFFKDFFFVQFLSHLIHGFRVEVLGCGYQALLTLFSSVETKTSSPRILHEGKL